MSTEVVSSGARGRLGRITRLMAACGPEADFYFHGCGPPGQNRCLFRLVLKGRGFSQAPSVPDVRNSSRGQTSRFSNLWGSGDASSLRSRRRFLWRPRWAWLPAGPWLLHKSTPWSRLDVRPLSLRSTVETPPLHRGPLPRSQQRPKGLGIVPLFIWVYRVSGHDSATRPSRAQAETVACARVPGLRRTVASVSKETETPTRAAIPASTRVSKGNGDANSSGDPPRRHLSPGERRRGASSSDAQVTSACFKGYRHAASCELLFQDGF
ncbi:hypothetical protein NDU88_007487 [Pleurodeles waltl]|uniref:Uncharacterized protein n=1 Tax=Pleurodeles waltl TaxID=8319 RepID=A0AAV7PP67_PLEWA|nr:hypothetical protein NDU88_007487 [Pleurodeles waltl]